MTASAPSLMQIRAHQACNVLGMSQSAAARMFGISQQAMSRRLQRHRERSLQKSSSKPTGRD